MGRLHIFAHYTSKKTWPIFFFLTQSRLKLFCRLGLRTPNPFWSDRFPFVTWFMEHSRTYCCTEPLWRNVSEGSDSWTAVLLECSCPVAGRAPPSPPASSEQRTSRRLGFYQQIRSRFTPKLEREMVKLSFACPPWLENFWFTRT